VARPQPQAQPQPQQPQAQPQPQSPSLSLSLSRERRLYLLRHAKSSWDDPALADHDRPLGPRGLRAGELLAEHVRRAGIAPQLVLCSTAVRTRETLALLKLGGDPDVVYERGLYAASEDVLLERLRAVDDGVATVLLVGHSSGIEQLALLLARSGPRLDEMREKFPTGALATLSFDGPWRKLGRGGAELTGYVIPREL
jgi:phosphohistidine phosphatase